MLYAGLGFSRKRLDFGLLDGEGATVEVGAAPADADGLLGLRRASRSASRADPRGDRVDERCAVCARSARASGLAGGDRGCAEGEGLAPLACKTDRIDAWVLAELTRRDLVSAIWLPDPLVRAERERARWRLHLVRLPLELEAADARRLADARQALPGLRSVRRPRPPAARPARSAGAVAGNARGQPASDRRARARDHRLRARAASARRRPALPAALADGARDRLAARLHDRRRARRHRPLRQPAQ